MTTILDAVDELAPTISARAAEIEAARRLPGDLLDQLHAAGCFRMLRPPSHGGAGLDLPAAMRVCEALARADGSVGWTVMIGAGAWCDLAGLPRATFDAVYAAEPDAIVAGAINPSGVAVPVDGGYQVNGRWGFASGCEHSSWLFGHCVEPSASDEEPQLRMVAFTRDEVEIEDTWTVSGMCGTGSHHFTVHGVVVPEERTYATFTAEPCLDEPVLRIPAPTLYPLLITSVALGIGQGALDDVVALATDKVRLFGRAPLAANPLFQHQLAVAHTELRAARLLLHEVAGEIWAAAGRAETPFSLDQRARVRSTATWATSRAAAAVDTVYHAGGGSSVYLASPLQRRFRDVHTLTQHFLVAPDSLTTAGAALAGQEVDDPVF